MRKIKYTVVSTAIGAGIVAAVALAIPAGSATAANGGAWLLGRSNAETATTTVSNTKGTPLKLNAKSGTAPLAVNSTKVVGSLNADMVDGYHASGFAMRSGKTGVIVASDVNQPAVCPAGTVSTGGGGLSLADAGGALGYSGPGSDPVSGNFIKNSWLALDANGYDAVSVVNCYSPSGAAIPGDIASVVATASLTRGATNLTVGQQAYLGHLKDLQARQGQAAAK
jgi:hypothetical protein